MLGSLAGPRNAALLVLLLLTAFAAPPLARAVPIDGKFGLGIDTGDLLSSGPEAALIYGKNEGMAWLFLVTVNGSVGSGDLIRDLSLPDTLIIDSQNRDGFSVSMGPGIRKFIRSKENFSPYFDVTIRGIRGVTTENSTIYTPTPQGRRFTEWAAEAGLAIGAEYFFERWPVSLAAHASLLTTRYSRRTQTHTGSFGRESFVDDSFSVTGGIGPRLQVRVYF